MANNNSVDGAKTKTIVRYEKCLHNHAAKMMGYILDGCGEFEPSGKEGTHESVYCAVCSCHRNFHKRVEVKLPECSSDQVVITHHNCPTIEYLPANQATNNQAQPRPCLDLQLPVAAEGVGMDKQLDNMNKKKRLPTRSKEIEMEGNKKPRLRPTPEQKEKLKAFAEKRGWKLLKHEEKNEDVIQFCSETGITAQFLKNWINYSRRKMALKQALVET